MKSAVYPGSFDPVTYGHLDILKRAQNFFDQLYILVAKSPDKKPMFSVEERIELLNEHVAGNVEIVGWDGLTVDFVREKNVGCIVRGVRSSVDFRMEQTLANVNYELNSNCETLLFCCRPEYRDLSSRLVKEIGWHGGPLDKFVPDNVRTKIQEKLKTLK